MAPTNRMLVRMLVLALLGAAALSALPAGVSAQARVGAARSGLPGVDKVGVVSGRAARAAAVASIGYGYTESVIADDDSHHRATGGLAGAYRPNDWLSLGLRLEGLHVTRSGGPDDGDAGTLTRTQLSARVGPSAREGLQLGGELTLRVPAAQSAGDGLSGISPELLLIAGYTPPRGRWTFSSRWGVRLDRSREGISDPSRYSLSDRVALGVSESNAVLTGLGIISSHGSIDVLAELTWDIQVGAKARAAGESPMWLTGGVRHNASDNIQIQALLGLSPSARPLVADGEPIALVEPRFFISLGVGLLFGVPPEPPPPAPPVPVAVVEPQPGAPTTGGVRGQVKGPEGEVLAEATISYARDGETVEVRTDAEGRFELTDLPVGPLELEIAAEGFVDLSQTVNVTAGDPAELELPALERPLPEGQIRGTVKDFSGKPLSGRVRIEPGGFSVQTGADGSFEVDVPPGDYTVRIRVPGHRGQRRKAKVHENGVTVIIFELRERR